MSRIKQLPTQLQEYVHKSRYARWLDDKQRRETWEETVQRYVDYFANKFPEHYPKEEIYSAIVNQDDMPSMRAMMTAGIALERDPMAGFNCSFVAIDDVRAFDEILYISMCGVGVGFSVERQFIAHLPAGSIYAKLIKYCFVAPKGWLFCGADFNSLEDYISALTTKDPNKLAVYEQGFDGHCLRAAYYFRDLLPAIDLTSAQSVNTIKKEYPQLRQDSKSPTFALTYQGTWHTLVNNLGFEEEKAKAIEKNYHVLYKHSDEYIQARLKQASIDGYVDVAFGLRVRTPLLKQVIFGSSRMPYEAAAEGRTAGNAMGQSYGLLNNRAAVEFMDKVRASKYRLDIKPVALIHDSIYLIIRDNIEVVEWVNRELINSMKWQELPEIAHPTVRLGANLDLFWPNWGNAITLPNDATQDEIMALAKKGKEDYGKYSWNHSNQHQ